MSEIIGFNTSWNGHTGEEVLNFINTYLNSNTLDIATLKNNRVAKLTSGYRIDPDTQEEDKTTIVINGLDLNNNVITSTEFSTITLAAYQLHFNSSGNDNSYATKDIISLGEDFEIPYDYYVEKDGEKIRGKQATVTFTILNQGAVKIFETYTYQSSTSNVLRPGAFVIPASYLGVGLNLILMSAVTTEGNTSTTPYTPSYTVYNADLRLNCSILNSNYYIPRASSDEFTLLFEVLDSAGHAVPNNYTVYKRIYVDRMDYSTYLSRNHYDITGESILTSYYSILSNTSAYPYADGYTDGTYRFLILAYMKDEDSIVATSNICLMLLFNSDGLNLLVNANRLYISTYIQDVVMYNSSVYINVNLYSTYPHKAYLYCKNGIQYTIQAGGETTEPRELPANVRTELNYSYTYREKGNFAFSIKDIGNDNSFDAIVRVQELETGFQRPSGAVLSLFASNKSVGDKNTSGWCTTPSGFDWKSNGWVSTSDGTALLINNGASLSIDNYYMCSAEEYTELDYPFTLSIKYKVENGSDETEELISCLQSNTGILIRPQYIELDVGTRISQLISNDEVHEVTFVYYGKQGTSIYNKLMAIYIDGKIQTIATAGAFVNHTKKLELKASKASLYVYSIQAYTSALSFTGIQSLYCFNQSDPVAIANYILRNDIFSVNTSNLGDYGQSVNREKLPNGSAILMLYSDVDDPTPWLTINGYAKSEENKGRRHALKGMRLYIKGEEANSRNFFAVGGCISAQGTSSMDYAIKNYRIYTNKKASGSGIAANDEIVGVVRKFYQGDSLHPLPAAFDPFSPNFDTFYSAEQLAEWEQSNKEYLMFSTEYGDSYTSAPANRFCLKADYAESSGTHNTGFARLSNFALKNSSPIIAAGITSENETSYLPLQFAIKSKLDNNESVSWNYDVRANIDGRPIYLFFVSPSYTNNGEEISSKEYYGGRYNMNNDKSNVQVFGFEQVTDYFDNPIVQAEGRYLLNKALETGIDPHYAETHKTTPDATFINPTECWEFSSNSSVATNIGSFYHPFNTAFTAVNGESDSVNPSYSGLLWINNVWEYRYPDLEDKEGDNFYRSGQSKPYLLYKTYEWLYSNNYAITNTALTLNNFADELHLYFNVNSVVKYFVLTHWFLAVDQRVKNAMLSFYCDPYGVSEEEANRSPLHYMRGYYIFYDNDTILGLNNTGAIAQPWNLYETDENKSYTSFPGNKIHALWYNLLKCYELYTNQPNNSSSACKLGKLVSKAYNNLRNLITDLNLTLYFETDLCRYYPDAILNVDLEVKYLNPNHLRSIDQLLDPPVYLNMAQGTREFHRKNFLSKRTKWLDDLYDAEQAKNFKLMYKTGRQNASDTGTITLKSASCFPYYNFYLTDNLNNNLRSVFNLPGQSASLTLIEGTNKLSISDSVHIYSLYGCSYIDFSNYSWDNSPVLQCNAEGIFPYLETFILNPYSNPSFRTATNSGVFSWFSPNIMPGLVELRACNIIGDDVLVTNEQSQVVATDLQFDINLRDDNTNKEFTRLSILDLRGTKVSLVILPNGPSLTSLLLENPTSIELINKPNLNTITIGTTNLDNLTVASSSIAVYDWALNAANTRKGLAKIEIEFGSSKELYKITSSNNNLNQLDLLYNLALAVLNGTVKTPQNSTNSNDKTLYIKGNIYTSVSYANLDIITEAFTDLTISDQLQTDEFGFKALVSRELREDSVVASFENNAVTNFDLLNCLYVETLQDVYSWRIDINNGNQTLDDKVKIVKTTKRRCWIHADPNGANTIANNADNWKLDVLVRLEEGGEEFSLHTMTNLYINIKYIPISLLTVTANSIFADSSGNSVTLNFNFGDHTKNYLLTSNNESNFSISTTAEGDITQGHYRYNLSTGFLEGYDLTLNRDTKITATIYGNSNSIDVYLDTILLNNLSDVDRSNSKYWIKKVANLVVQGDILTLGNFVKKSQAAQINLNSNNIWNNLVLDLSDTSQSLVNLDFSDLKFFKYPGEFILPIVPMTVLTTPIGCSAVKSSCSNQLPSDMGKITINPGVSKLIIDWNLTSDIPSNVEFDISNTNITTIGNYGNTIDKFNANIASVLISLLASLHSSIREKSLFSYPSTILKIGNTNIDIITAIGSTPSYLMFNLKDTNGNLLPLSSVNSYPGIVKLTGFSTSIELGAICSYNCSDLIIIGENADEIYNNVIVTKYSFIYNNNISSSPLVLPSVLDFGDYSLYRDLTFVGGSHTEVSAVKLNSDIESIGNYAFAFGNYHILSGNNNFESDSVIQQFNNIKTLGNNCFLGLNVSQTLLFGEKLEYVGSNCFTNGNEVPIKIYLDKTTAFEQGKIQPTSFGNSSSAFVYIYIRKDIEGQNGETTINPLWTLLKASGMECRDRVIDLNSL